MKAILIVYVFLILAVAGLVFGIIGEQLSIAIIAVVLAWVILEFVRLGPGLRHLLTGMSRDLAETEKTREEIKKIRAETAKTHLDIVKAREEIKTMVSRIHQPTREETFLYSAEIDLAPERRGRKMRREGYTSPPRSFDLR